MDFCQTSSPVEVANAYSTPFVIAKSVPWPIAAPKNLSPIAPVRHRRRPVEAVNA